MNFNPKDLMAFALVGGSLYYTLSKKTPPEWLILATLVSSFGTLIETGQNLAEQAKAGKATEPAQMAGCGCGGGKRPGLL